MPKMLDLFCGRFGWSREFAARGWDCVGIDLVEPPEIPERCTFIKANILDLRATAPGWFSIREHHDRGPILWEEQFDFICGSSPCEQFSIHGMKHFHPDPPYPALGITLFNHTRTICSASGRPYIMENVRPAQNFVGTAVNHCGPFYLWGHTPPCSHRALRKGLTLDRAKRFAA